MIDKNEILLLINQEIEKTEKAIAQHEDMNQPQAPDVAIGRVSRMDAINNKAMTQAALNQANQKLNALKGALNRINEPDFGLCAKCHGTIPLGRILLVPQSRFCVNCAK